MIPGDRELVRRMDELIVGDDMELYYAELRAHGGRLLRIAHEGVEAQDRLARITAVITGEDRRDS